MQIKHTPVVLGENVIPFTQPQPQPEPLSKIVKGREGGEERGEGRGERGESIDTLLCFAFLCVALLCIDYCPSLTTR